MHRYQRRRNGKEREKNKIGKHNFFSIWNKKKNTKKNVKINGKTIIVTKIFFPIEKLSIYSGRFFSCFSVFRSRPLSCIVSILQMRSSWAGLFFAFAVAVFVYLITFEWLSCVGGKSLSQLNVFLCVLVVARFIMWNEYWQIRDKEFVGRRTKNQKFNWTRAFSVSALKLESNRQWSIESSSFQREQRRNTESIDIKKQRRQCTILVQC